MNDTLNIFSLFSGIGAFEKALANLGIPYNLLAYCEIDKYASKSYSVIHDVPEEKNLHDVTKVTAADLKERIDLITYGFPCQDISVAGKQKGFADENGERTRSGLFFEALRIIEDYKPKFAIAENVKALTGKKFKEEFRIVLESLENAGYVNYWQVLNAKDYGIPQNRERVFIISIRKDIDKGFVFPDVVPLELRLKDMLDEDVKEKFYLSEKMLSHATLDFSKAEKSFIDIVGHSGTGGQKGFIHTVNGGLGALAATDYKQPKQIIEPSINMLGMLDIKGNEQVRRVYGIDGLTPTLNTAQGGNRQAKILEPDILRIRKLTPSEYFKLMGFPTEDCKKCSEAGISNTQLYKQAGNSIVVNVLEAIFKSLGEVYDEFKKERTEDE